MNILEKLARQAAQRATQTGELQYTRTGYLVLQVPNALVHGQFAALNLPGIELPPGPDGRLNAHITVMTPEEVQRVGGPARISERGKHFSYTTGAPRSAPLDARHGAPASWRDVGRIWFLPVRSTELARLRKSYGLDPQPRRPFHITVAVRRRSVLREGAAAKAASMHQLAAKAATYLRERQGGRDHELALAEAPRARGDRHVPGTQVQGHAAGSAAKTAGEGRPLGSVDVSSLAQRARQRLLEKLSRTVTYSRTLSEAARRAVTPTEAQAEAGNYRKGHLRLQGLDISIETPKGRRRKPEWPPLQNHYGYIKRTEGKDGDHVDVFVGPDTAGSRVYVVDQIDPGSGAFDEHKVMLGFGGKEEAQRAYQANYEKGWDGMGTVTALSMGQFKAWLREGDQTKPVAEQTLQFKTAAADGETAVVLAVRRGAAISLVAPEAAGRQENVA